MQATLLLLVLVVCGHGSGLALSTSLLLEGSQTTPLAPSTLPYTPHTHGFFYDTKSIHDYGLFTGPTATITATTLTAPQSFNEITVKPAILLGDIPAAPDYQGRVARRQRKPASPQRNFVEGNDPDVSPYWADPDGRAPSQLPSVVPEDLAPNTQTCRDVPVPCNTTAKYRTITGRCNNLQRPQLGTSGQPMSRVLPPVFDGAWMRLRSGAGGLLPNPRQVSLGIMEVPPGRPTSHNLMVMQIGQFVDHDLSVVPTLKGPTQTPTRRCEECKSWRDLHCAPIPIPSDDPYIKPHDYQNQRLCLPFVRSEAVSGRDSLGRQSIEQLSLNTAFLDLSTVYGSDHCREKHLRLYSFGMLAELRQAKSDGGFPILRDAVDFEECRAEGDKCFFVGDERSNEQLGLMVTHVLFFREHNRLARELTTLNPHWDDEEVYQEARRINIAQYQHIVYSQFLPELLGPIKIADYRLEPESSGYYQGYDSSANPSILNEFSTAAFRVGHTMVPDELVLMDSHYLPVASVPIVTTFHNSSMTLLPKMCDQVLRGLMGTRLQPIDLQVVKTLSNKLFEGPQLSGQDLIARNIARARDHGLPPYVQYREACGGPVTTTFDDLLTAMPRQAVHALSRTYARVEDVDLFVGGLAEFTVSGGLVGPTFACLIGYQFFNLRRGDRFWYENADAGFTPAQLRVIRSTSTLNRLLCDNMDGWKERIPASLFHLPSQRGNPLLPCDHLTSLDLSLWKEHYRGDEVDCEYLGRAYPHGRHVHVSHCLVCLCQAKGLLRCQPNPSGCKQPEQDEHCRLIC